MPAPGKKFSKTYTDSKTGRTRHVSYGAKGYKIKPGTSAGDSYCARSYGISQKADYDCAGKDKNKPNCLSRKKWRCKGKKSMKESVDDLITDMLAVSFHADPDGKVQMEPTVPEESRQNQIARHILQLAQELLTLSGSNQVITSVDFENLG